MGQLSRVETHSEPPIHNNGECNRRGVVGGELVVAGGDPAPVLEAAKGALDQIAQAVEGGIEPVVALAGRVVGDDRQRASIDQQLTDSVAVVGSVGDAQPGRWQRFDQRRRDRQVVPLAGAQREGERPALAVDDGMDLGRPAAA